MTFTGFADIPAFSTCSSFSTDFPRFLQFSVTPVCGENNRKSAFFPFKSELSMDISPVNESATIQRPIMSDQRDPHFENVLLNEANETMVKVEADMDHEPTVNQIHLNSSNMAKPDASTFDSSMYSFGKTEIKIEYDCEENSSQLEKLADDNENSSCSDDNESLFEANLVKIESSTEIKTGQIHVPKKTKNWFATCIFCKEAFPTTRELIAHHLNKHDNNSLNQKNSDTDPPERSFKCDACDKLFTSLNYLNRHKRIHMGKVQCRICRRSFPDENMLDEHMSTPDVHKVLKCDDCPYVTNIKRNLTKHRFTHSPSKTYLCDICNKVFKTLEILNRHKPSHNGLLRCAICNKRFADQSSLDEHKATPDVHKTFNCDKCQYTTVYKADMKKHFYTHLQDKTFKCDVCDKFFKTLEYLNQHKFMHKGFFRCSICNKKFVNKDALDEHKAAPDSHKRFTCDQCPYVTNKKVSLNRHRFQHSQNKCFNCEICNKLFRSRDSVKLHYKKIHSV